MTNDDAMGRDDSDGNSDNTAATELKDDDVYAVFGIKGRRKRNGQVEYHIRWKGYKPKDDTW